jgi:hypothetical protein
MSLEPNAPVVPVTFKFKGRTVGPIMLCIIVLTFIALGVLMMVHDSLSSGAVFLVVTVPFLLLRGIFIIGKSDLNIDDFQIYRCLLGETLQTIRWDNVSLVRVFPMAVGIMTVDSDEEALRLMNDSEFGLTAAIFSANAARTEALGDVLETGTVFLNRCDYLDPSLAWTGVKNSGRGCTLSRIGFEQLTRPKSYHFRLTT